MATIAGIIKNGRGKAGPWRVERSEDTRELWHYGTRMLVWTERPCGTVVLDWDTGHGSVSDQGGMNTAFKVLGIRAYFSRKGGATIEEINR